MTEISGHSLTVIEMLSVRQVLKQTGKLFDSVAQGSDHLALTVTPQQDPDFIVLIGRYRDNSQDGREMYCIGTKLYIWKFRYQEDLEARISVLLRCMAEVMVKFVIDGTKHEHLHLTDPMEVCKKFIAEEFTL